MCSRRSCRSGSSRGAAAAALLLASASAYAAPFPTRDQNPLLAGFGLPMPMPARIGPTRQWSFDANFNWGSTALMQADGSEGLIVDAETREARLTLRGSLNETTALQFQIPYRYTGSGTLDGFIDNWHDIFGLPEGARNVLPDDNIRIAYVRGNARFLEITTSSSGLGDISADLGRELLSRPSTSAVAWFSLKLPSGDSDKLTGSGAVDASLIIAADHRFSDRWSTFGQLGVTYLGDGDFLPDRQRSVVWSGLAGIGWRALDGLELKVQLDAHTEVFESQLEFLGDSVSLTLGGSLRFNARWQLDVAVSEDIVTEASPDVVFVIAVRRGLGE